MSHTDADTATAQDTACMDHDSPADDAPNPSTPAPAQSPTPPAQTIADLEAVLFSLDKPLSDTRLAEALQAAGHHEATPGDIPGIIEALNEAYDGSARAFRIERVAGGYRLMTRPEHAPAVAAVRRLRAGGRLSRAALETMAIIAYRQPITRADLEAIRGVACGEVLRSLLERRFITIKGRAEELGRPMLYGTTKQFLDAFGLASLSDLPKPDELTQLP